MLPRNPTPVQTRLLSADDTGIAAAAALLAAGDLVAIPTETVYGLAGDARNGTAVARIFEAKGRPSFNPLIVHVADAEMARAYADWTDTAQRLADAFWPGPLTLVLPLRAGSGLSALVTAGHGSVALRVPAHPVAGALLRSFGGPLAAPSANPSGRISPTSAAHVANGLGGRIAAILDGGACDVGVESTIVGLTGAPTLLRPGGLPSEAIEEVIGTRLTRRHGDAAITAPGQMSSHYAPNAQIRLNAGSARPGETLLGFGATEGAALNLSPSGDLTEAAANLFEYLHRLDRDARAIAVAPVPDRGLGRAINDRLRRAAAPRGI
ncbi:threonylcarbamoyl-AMP synthase [Pelagivirga sediminicola]|uniref:Threonylcarbamoyl-AMP synthase n=1 Tax=Pelagivirga sediminicola TaxID=2170575 RepID=A0A2T7G5D1_9RHOB|nr:L-threonylcarbamoyladenylate synthase [Pelagivirga sediminicola]PVA09624.1 threonylcarbamoyl-AMP synthase [Pelagivirga sediminicola]